MTSNPAAEQIDLLLTVLDQAFDKKSWHGTNLRGSLRGITHSQASWRPAAERHNIWELTLHGAYWKYIVRRRLLGERRGSFPHKGSDWFPRPEGRTTKPGRSSASLPRPYSVQAPIDGRPGWMEPVNIRSWPG